MKPTADSWSSVDGRILFGLVGLLLTVGLVLAPDYGMSLDEYFEFHYAEDALKAYRGSDAFLDHGHLPQYGTAHLMFGTVFSQLLSKLSWKEADARHLANFLTFVGGIAAFYYLVRQAMGRASGLLATLLLATQPLLFGQAFINQKDIPFMGWFLATVALGWLVVRRVEDDGRTAREQERGTGVRLDSLWSGFLADWRSQAFAWRIAVTGALLAVFALAIELLYGGHLLAYFEGILGEAYRGQAAGPIQSLFDRVAEDAYKTPLRLYVGKLIMVFGWARVVVIGLSISAVLYTGVRAMPTFRSRWRRAYPTVLPATLLAGFALGIATAVRIGGPLAGMIVLSYWFWRLKGDAAPLLVPYAGTAAVVTVLTWPYLWADPLGRLIHTAREMSSFSAHTVLYRGNPISSHQLPWQYALELGLFRLTIPAVFLAAAGLAVAVWWMMQDRPGSKTLVLALLWFGLPFGAVTFGLTPVHGNLRHLYFALPPLFLLAGAALEVLFRRLPYLPIILTTATVVLAPGLYQMVRLHPFEHAYFNQLAGGSSGAYGNYMVDPWCTSYREAMEYVNREAPENATVAVRTAMEAAREFAREDLTVSSLITGEERPDYALLCRLELYGDESLTNYETVYEVRRGEAILARVKKKLPVSDE